jgi:galactokinase/mevalonate kinase-like predicted kinase
MRYGLLMDKQWQVKRKSQPKQFSDLVDLGKECGALSGKLCGAGLSGCVLFVCPNPRDDNEYKMYDNMNVLCCRVAGSYSRKPTYAASMVCWLSHL